MSETKYLITCAGKGERWDNYLDTHKHLIMVDGERLLDRICRMIFERNPHAEIVIVIPEVDLSNHDTDENIRKNYHVENCTQWQPETVVYPCRHGVAPAIYTVKPIWSTEKRTTILFGDVFFTEEAMNKIIAPIDGVMFYGRSRASQVTGTKHGELWGCSFLPENHEKLYNCIMDTHDKYMKKIVHRWLHWDIYWNMYNIKNKLPKKGTFIEINDWTEDFDYPEDYDRWLENRKM